MSFFEAITGRIAVDSRLRYLYAIAWKDDGQQICLLWIFSTLRPRIFVAEVEICMRSVVDGLWLPRGYYRIQI